MHRSNRIHLLLGTLLILVAVLVWAWTQRLGLNYKLWASWLTATYASITGFLIWMQSLRYARLIDDIPTSQVATAAQGYVELFGRATQHKDQQAKSMVGTPVLWYRKEFSERSSDGHWRAFPFNALYMPTETEESETPFAIIDSTGIACVLPYGAEIICERRSVRHSEHRRVIEEWILPGDLLYVLGDFSTYAREPPGERAAYDLTRQWQNNPARRRMFDLDGDGKLNQKEWLAMHDAAKANVAEEHFSAEPPDAKHLVFKPNDGRPYLISSIPPDKLAGRYTFYLYVGFLLFLGGGAASFAIFVAHLVN